MSNAMSFFRVFDLAFFAPGSLLLTGLYFAEQIKVPSEWMARKVSSVSGVLTLAITIGGSYMLGLLLHGVTEIFHCIYSCRYPTKTQRSWYQALSQKDTANELALYFWYMRATSRNLCTCCSLLVFAAILVQKWWLLWFIVPGGIFAFLGLRFNGALERATVYNHNG